MLALATRYTVSSNSDSEHMCLKVSFYLQVCELEAYGSIHALNRICALHLTRLSGKLFFVRRPRWNGERNVTNLISTITIS